MARTYKVKFANKEGQKIQRRFNNGIVETLLPVGKESEWYIENVLVPAQEQVKAERKEHERKFKIQRKLTEMAEKELEKEGEL